MTTEQAQTPDDALSPVTIRYECRPGERAEASTVLMAAARTGGARPPSGYIEVAPAGKFNRGVFGWALFLALGIMLVLLLMNEPAAPTRAGTPVAPLRLRGAAASTLSKASNWPVHVKLLTTCFGVGVICLAGSLVFGAAATRRQRRRWDGLLRFTFAPDALVRSRPGRTEVRHWACFPGYLETRNLLVVRLGSRRGYVFPKRLFASEPDAARARQMLERAYHVPAPAVPTLGFPVTMPPEQFNTSAAP